MPPQTELQKALGKSNPTVAEVERALATIPNINEPYKKGDKITYLMYAAAYIKDVNILKLLIAKGADITLKDKNGFNALDDAVSFNTLEIVKFFVEEKGMNVNKETKDKETPLHLAITNADTRILPYLIERGAKLNAQDKYGVTPLMKAVNHFKTDIVKLLLEKGALVAFEGIYGNTALHILLNTAYNNYTNPKGLEIVKLLVENGADVNAKNKKELTPLMEAVKVKNPAYAIYLVEKGANINDQESSEGKTPLIFAAMFDRVELIKFLLEKGADKTLRTKDGQTALDFATSEEARILLTGFEPESNEPFKGFTKSDIDLLNTIFEKPSDISLCPVCLEYAERKDGCMYMTHACRKPHKELFATYSSLGGKIEWCTLCGRVSQQHHHFNYAPPDAPKPGFAPIQPTSTGDFRFFDKDCKASGGGGHEEKVRRFNRMLHYACELQSEVGKLSETEGRKELIEETWKGADIRMRNVPKILEQKKFDFPCEFPADTVPGTETEKVYPDISKPTGLQPNPIKHESPDNECLVELGEHDDHRPVFQFIHKQPDGTTWEHKDEYICGQDLESAIRSKPMDGTCPINPEKCKGKIYPEELKGVVSPEFYEVYRQNFNKANATKTGGAESNMFNHVVNETCAMPPKSKGGRKTYRKKKQQKKRKTFRRSVRK